MFFFSPFLHFCIFLSPSSIFKQKWQAKATFCYEYASEKRQGHPIPTETSMLYSQVSFSFCGDIIYSLDSQINYIDFFLYLYCSLAYPVFGLLKNLKSFKLQTFYFFIRVLFLFCKYYKSIFSSPVTDNTTSPHLLPLKTLQHQYHILENCSLNKLHLKPLIFEPLFSCAVQTCFGFNMQPSIISILHLPALFGELGATGLCLYNTLQLILSASLFEDIIHKTASFQALIVFLKLMKCH